MKLVVFAHTPPPFHGQSYMVQLMLESFGGDQRRKSRHQPTTGTPGIECYHVNARVSRNLEDVGGARLGKLVLLVGHCLQALWCRFRYGAKILYYVPAPGKSFTLYRDWLVMGVCRPFFKRVIFHWHATSMAKWLETSRTIRTRDLTYRFLGHADLSIVLSQYNRFNAEKMWPRRIAVVVNGIPDPCPQFETAALPRRQARLAARRKLAAGQILSDSEHAAAGPSPQRVRVLFLAHCTREKGMFDAVHAVLLANSHLRAQRSPLGLQLIVTGIFPNAEEKREFDAICSNIGGQPAAETSGRAPARGGSGKAPTSRSEADDEASESGLSAADAPIQYAGFVQGAQKEQSLLDADLLCFPSHWENQPVSVIEALAYGLPIAISRLPSVVEMLPPGYTGVANIRNIEQLADAMLELVFYDGFSLLRRHFLEHFTLASFSSNLAAALRSVEAPDRQA